MIREIKCFFGIHEYVESKVHKGAFFGCDWQAPDKCKYCGSYHYGYYCGVIRESKKEDREFISSLFDLSGLIRRTR